MLKKSTAQCQMQESVDFNKAKRNSVDYSLATGS